MRAGRKVTVQHRSEPARELGLAAKVAALRRPETYPDRPARIETVETHMSWVFLTERHAYKLKKPVHYEFLDFRTLAARRKSCLEELRLNRALAGDVYLGVVALTVDARGEVRLQGEGEAVEWLVRMRRLPAERMLDAVVRRAALRSDEVYQVAVLLAAFYRHSAPVRLSGEQYRQRCLRLVRDNFDALLEPAYGLPRERIAALHETLLALPGRVPEWFERRALEQRIVEGHGDLRPEHVCLLSPPVIFDRLEFNREFRIVDAADELASLSVECERLGDATMEPALFRVYEEVIGDRPPPALVAFYKAYRATLRAKLAIWHVRELPRAEWPKWQSRAGEYVALAEKYAASL